MSAVTELRPPPCDLDAEAAVVSALLLDPERIDGVREILPVRAFYADANRRIYEAILSVREDGRAVDAVSVAAWLREHNRLAQIGGMPYLAQISDATPAVANVESHAELVRAAAVARSVSETCARVAAEGRGALPDPEAWAQRAAEQVALSAGMDAPAPRSARNPGAAWPILDVAGIFGPLEPQRFICAALDLCAGAPALVAGYGFSGKTVALQSAAISIAAGLPLWGAFTAERGRVLHVDFEQGPRLTREKYQRIAAGLMVPPQELEGQLELVSMPQVYFDQPTAEGVLRKRCAGFDLMIVDSLRAACPSLEENDSGARAVLDMLNRVSAQTGCAVLVIHHARKPQREAAGGAKASIRGSGAIFDACSSVLVFEGEKGRPTRVHHEKARTTGRPLDDFMLRIEDTEVDGHARAGLVVAAEDAPSMGGANTAALDAEVLERVKAHPGASGRQVWASMPGRGRDTVLDSLARLSTAGHVESRQGARRATAWWPIGGAT